MKTSITAANYKGFRFPVLATWAIRSKIRDFRRNGFSLQSNFSLTEVAGSLAQWCELHVSI